MNDNFKKQSLLKRLNLQLSRERRFYHLLFKSKLLIDLEELNAEIDVGNGVVHTVDKIINHRQHQGQAQLQD